MGVLLSCTRAVKASSTAIVETDMQKYELQTQIDAQMIRREKGTDKEKLEINKTCP